MFKEKRATAKSEASREHILQVALKMFRKQGFDEVTMRDIAREAEVALGAAYYYFPSKEALVVAYYVHVQEEHTKRVREALAGKKLDLRGRLGVVMHTKIDIIQDDRKLIGAPFRYTGIPDHPLSFLGPGTRKIRQQAVEVIDEVLAGESLPKDITELLPRALWALQMGLMLYFLYDDSPQQKRTRRLIDGSLDLAVRFIDLAKFPLLKPFRGRVLALLKDAELA